jgi:ATP-dependent RNA helicase DeaD
VLDEADEMLDMGFREDLEEILDATPETRRTLLFSATMPRPIVALAKRYQRDALRISTLDERQGHGDIAYQAVAVSPSDIEHAVINLLRYHEAETAMLFCATRDNVRHLHASLVERGFAAVALSGEHSQSERNHALQALRDGRAGFAATDVAARGIDVATLSLVACGNSARCRNLAAPFGPHGPRRAQGHGGAGGALSAPPPGGMILRAARVEAEWVPVPGAEAIRERDRERMLEKLSAPVEITEEDQAIADRLLAEKTPQESRWRWCAPTASRCPSPRNWPMPPPRPPAATGARVLTIRCGSAWTSAAARTPIRADPAAAVPPWPYHPHRSGRDPHCRQSDAFPDPARHCRQVQRRAGPHRARGGRG